MGALLFFRNDPCKEWAPRPSAEEIDAAKKLRVENGGKLAASGNRSSRQRSGSRTQRVEEEPDQYYGDWSEKGEEKPSVEKTSVDKPLTWAQKVRGGSHDYAESKWVAKKQAEPVDKPAKKEAIKKVEDRAEAKSTATSSAPRSSGQTAEPKSAAASSAPRSSGQTWAEKVRAKR